uniref:Charged multivesicular body protein 4C n=1 Tax=Neogobius melanostomus TaxID=47308 RepID=A0A8C6UYG3_9GOBI
MSKISKLFKGSSSSGSHSSSSSKSKHRSRGAPSPQEAIHKLRETEEMLTKKQAFLEGKIEQELATAKKHGTRNKRVALQALKRKKRYEEQLKQIDGTLSTIEFQRDALENSHTNTEVLKNMGYAAKAMKKVHESLDVNNIEDLMSDISEQQDIAREITDAISGPIGETFDEDELMAELAELEQEELEDTMGELPSVPASKLPAAPRGHRSSARRTADEENDMRMLASWGT